MSGGIERNAALRYALLGLLGDSAPPSRLRRSFVLDSLENALVSIRPLDEKFHLKGTQTLAQKHARLFSNLLQKSTTHHTDWKVRAPL